jgi:hypothetical protein
VLESNALWRLVQVFCEERHGAESGSAVREVL